MKGLINMSIMRVNLSKLVEEQVNVWGKFEDVESIYFRSMSDLEFINMIDFYSMHIVEELTEVNIAEDRVEYGHELADVILYLFAELGILKQYIGGHKYEDIIITEEDITLYENKSSDSIMMEIVNKMMLFRRKFPMRKAHKRHLAVERTPLERLDIVRSNMGNIEEAVKLVLILSLKTFSVEEVESSLLDKYEIALNF